MTDRLVSRNKKLAKELREVKNSLSMQNAALQNSMSSLVANALGQANITSFNPLIENTIYAPLTINWMLLTYMYKTHGIIQTAIDVPVLDAFRGGLELHSGELSADELKDLTDRLEEEGILTTIVDVFKWARLYGGAALIINTDQDSSEPLDMANAKMFALYAANRWELTSPMREAEYYNFYGKRVHHSRVITVCGKEAPYVIRWQLAGWGMSEIERMVEDFNRYLKTNEVLYELLHEAKIDVYRFNGLNDQLVSQAGTEQTQRRVQLMNQTKSFQDALIMDIKDEYDQKQLTFTGLAEVTKENRISIAAALRMPMTKLFGLSASGFNSGEDDIENYNAMVESEVRTPARRIVKTILNLMVMQDHGFEADLNFEYAPLRVLSSVEEETVKTSRANRHLADYDRGLLDSHEYGMISEKEKLVPIETAASKGILESHPEMAQGDEGDGDGSGEGKSKSKGKGD